MYMACNRIINPLFTLVTLSLVFLLSEGCSSEKGAYNSWQYWREQECFRDPSRNSPECLEQGVSYEVYERQRQRSGH
ncbi:MAG: hypothetical protein NPIRA02_38920 [Nitrospirales bacterium]|nr:MAG: hypothetical protein NPIRA02_38920 [Nitrospirales bacterium]